MSELLQFTLSGLTMGAIYSLVAIGFVLIYNASEVVNFAQGEFVMIGGMVAVFAFKAGIPLPWAVAMAIAAATVIGLMLYAFAIRPAGNASIVTLIIITIGASIFLRGLASVLFDKSIHKLPDFVPGGTLQMAGATIQAQSLLVLFGVGLIVGGLWLFLSRTLPGKAMLATAASALAARLSGINTSLVIASSFAVSGAIGAIGGALITPVALTAYDVGAPLALKGFTAAVLGGLGHPLGAVVGGLLLGLLEAFGAGFISSLYKDAIAFVVLLLVLMFLPRGLFASAKVDRV
ncbi:MAG: branched-chain amino acid ABC transporter permease [Hydrogenophaga sp.]|uniref:branched-chain amino acid ABC transporter permease n=1 Tax=Hydrogenophaga sp. TaxID=1904254 RepID=UPI00261D07D2|nr:branched-chain amino acid ABC transporter permease [Hydrogenophaga sp.]MCW5668687.1 branched-chain amino acid ABC transporter permease [Hydrogenophaga sp.]